METKYEPSVNTYPTAIEMATSPLILLTGSLRQLYANAFFVELSPEIPLTHGPQISKLLSQVSATGYELEISGFDQVPDKKCKLHYLPTGERFEVWGRTTAEAVLRCCGLAALKRCQAGVAA
ncbi:MAG: hypothetical protein H6581_23205 [Bacteroidia bacterium]|nr:hypothetical protein [Bacteroidia bacterium]